jgi:hypothetical protein
MRIHESVGEIAFWKIAVQCFFCDGIELGFNNQGRKAVLLLK